MRAALWFLALFAVASALALVAGHNQGSVTLFWPPWRLDLSVNLVLLLVVGAFVLTHLALRAMAALLDMPGRARRWRQQQRERAMHAGLLDALVQLGAGRYLRARRAAETALTHQQALDAESGPPHGARVAAVAQLLAAEAAQELRDRSARDEHLRAALAAAPASGGDTGAVREAVLLRAARWALDDRDPQAAMAWLAELPQGAARRTAALRLKLKAARQDLQWNEALETTRLLAKHRAFSPEAARALVRGLTTDLLRAARDAQQLQAAWGSLPESERAMPEPAAEAARRLVELGGDAALARQWLLPAWNRLPDLAAAQRLDLVRALEPGLADVDAEWLGRIEAAHQQNPRDPALQYLAGMACLRRQLWGKARQLLGQASTTLDDPQLLRATWRALAELAEQREDTEASLPSDFWVLTQELEAAGLASYDISALSDYRLTVFRRKNIGLVFQTFNLLPTLTCEENIALPMLLGDGSPPRGNVDRLIFELGIERVRRRLPDSMSGGEQQRVAIGRALVSGPSLILADEPTGSLDSVNGRKLCGIFRRLCTESQSAVLMVTHNPIVAFEAERVVILRDGHVISAFQREEYPTVQALTQHYIELVENKHGEVRA